MLALMLALACTKTPDTIKPDDTATELRDADGDGFSVDEGDCDDADPLVAPGATERCDGVDQDCDGDIDEDVRLVFYADTDADGFGDPASPREACEQPPAHVPTGTDCDDARADVYPGADEACDGVDQDCDGEIDDGRRRTVHADFDGDGFGDPGTTREVCEDEVGWVSNATDCDDRTEEAFPGHPEVCDEVDNDCDGTVDEGTTTRYYEDRDGDGYGATGSAEDACVRPTGYAAAGGDCDDADSAYNPGVIEVCTDPRDLNCDGSVGYADVDGDGFAACAECDDLEGAVSPAALEVCNDVDDDCDGATDDADPSLDRTTGTVWYADGDGDGFGAGVGTFACGAPAGMVATAGDCDDTDAATSPAGLEVCNGIDDDCDGDTDDDDADLDLSSASDWYTDADRDGWGAGSALLACEAPAGAVSNDGDCDDGETLVNPSSTEVCNGWDDDCDGATDDDDADLDASSTSTWYADADGDGHGDAASAWASCEAPASTSTLADDCDDTDADVYPDAPEAWDCVDQDCDGALLPVGDGRDGSASASGTFSTTSTALSGGASAGASTLTVASASGFSAGDLALVYTAQGTGAGAWDVVTIASTSGSTLSLTGALSRGYGASDTTWVLRIPQYDTLTVPAGSTLAAPAWAGASSAGGGIVAFVARDLRLAGTVSAAARGYRGGSRNGARVTTAEQGETYTGTGSRSSAANRTGGGGGYSASLTHADGGGGGHRTGGGTGGTPGGWGNSAGVGGGTAGSADLLTMLMGGGGGAGGLDSDAEGGSYGGAGGTGGGLVLVSAGSLAFTGTITASGGNGETGYYAGSAASPGGGGGGAGGSVWLGAASVTSATGSLTAGGGSGGVGSEAGAGATSAGSGGTGAIRETVPGSVSASPSAYATCP